MRSNESSSALQNSQTSSNNSNNSTNNNNEDSRNNPLPRRRSTRHRNYLNRSQLHNAVELPDGYGKFYIEE